MKFKHLNFLEWIQISVTVFRDKRNKRQRFLGEKKQTWRDNGIKNGWRWEFWNAAKWRSKILAGVKKKEWMKTKISVWDWLDVRSTTGVWAILKSRLWLTGALRLNESRCVHFVLPHLNSVSLPQRCSKFIFLSAGNEMHRGGFGRRAVQAPPPACQSGLLGHAEVR